MKHVNRVELLGFVADPPRLIPTKGQPVCNIRLCTQRKWKDRTSGQMEERNQYHSVATWGGDAERASRLAQGDLIYVVGDLRSRSYQTEAGETKWVVEVNAETWAKIIDEEPAEERAAEAAPPPAQAPAAAGDDDLPF